MFRAHRLLAASLVAALGCSDSSTYSTDPGGLPRELELSGTVAVEFRSGPPAIRLMQPSGESTRLVGQESYRLIRLAGAEIQVRGIWVASGPPLLSGELMNLDPSSAFSVNEFVVLAVGGRPAMDGVLVEEDGQFGLRLSDGSIHTLEGDVTALAGNIGSRIWITGSNDDPPFTYGIIF